MSTTRRHEQRPSCGQAARRGPRSGAAQRRTPERQGHNHTLYVFDEDWRLIEELAKTLGWTYGRTHGWLLRFLLPPDTRRVSKLASQIRALEEGDPTHG